MAASQLVRPLPVVESPLEAVVSPCVFLSVALSAAAFNCVSSLVSFLVLQVLPCFCVWAFSGPSPYVSLCPGWVSSWHAIFPGTLSLGLVVLLLLVVLEPEEEQAEVCTFLFFEGVAACGGALDFNVVRRGACSFLVCWQVLEVFLGCPTWLVCLVRVLILIVVGVFRFVAGLHCRWRLAKSATCRSRRVSRSGSSCEAWMRRRASALPRLGPCSGRLHSLARGGHVFAPMRQRGQCRTPWIINGSSPSFLGGGVPCVLCGSPS